MKELQVFWFCLAFVFGILVTAAFLGGCSVAQADEPAEFRRCVHHCDTTWLPRYHECKDDAACRARVENLDFKCIRECQGIK